MHQSHSGDGLYGDASRLGERTGLGTIAHLMSGETDEQA